MLEFFNYLNSIYQLSPEAAESLMKVIKLKELRKGQVWLQQGQTTDRFTFVVTGLLKQYFEPNNRELVLNLFGKNGVILPDSSFRCLFLKTAIRAVEPTILLYIFENELHNITRLFPELQVHFIHFQGKYIANLEAHLSLLLLPPKERFQTFHQNQSLLENVTDRIIAAYLGVGANAICKWRKADQ